MTIWLPDLSDRRGPRYLAIADALADDIASGRLKEGERLPTHRELAYRLGITVGTVSRAYAEAETRGLTVGEVGRGTFIRKNAISSSGVFLLAPGHHRSGIVDFGLNLPVQGDGPARLAESIARLSKGPGILSKLLDYQPELGLASHRAAGAAWLRLTKVHVDADRIAVTSGAQHGLAATLMAISRPGNLVLTEHLTWPGIKDLADQLHLRLHGVEMDELGLRPDAFESACRSMQPVALYTMPTLQNPTAVVMPDERRRKVVDIARHYGVTIIEDDVYGFLLGDSVPTPLAMMAPEQVYYITSMAKCLMPGLRVGFVAAPPGKVDRIGAAVRVTIRMTPPLLAEVVSGWIADGTAAAMVTIQRDQVRQRQAIARRLFERVDFNGNELTSDHHAFHMWLPMPKSWRVEDFVTEARRQDVILMGAEPFQVDRGHVQRHVRVCLGAPPTLADVERGLTILAGILERHMVPNRAVV